MKRHTALVAAALLILGLGASAAWAQNSQDFGDYIVYFHAFPTDFLAPSVAKHYGITRSKSRALLNVVVQRKVLNNPGEPVAARVSAHAVNLNGQLKELDVREVKDGAAIYYLSDFTVSNEETLDFTLEVAPVGQPTTYKVQFRHQFFTD